MGHKIKQSLVNSRIEFFYYAFRNVLLVSIPLLVVSGVILSHLSFHSSAYSSSTDSVSLSLPTSCTINANVLTPHNATLVNGQYEGNIGNTRINAYCNDNNGYFIYAIGSSNDTDGNTDLISNINDNYNIHTNVYNSNTITTNTPSSWAMKLTSSNGTYAPTIVDGYNNYNLIPSTDTIVAYRLSGTSMDLDTDLTGSYFNTTYEIYTNPIQPAGTYLGKVKYTMTHPYDASQLTTMEEAFDIAGKDKVQVTDPITGETDNYYKMQDMSSRICSLTTAYETEEKLVDIRDNKLYYVSKLKDGHCWMTQNLDLDIVAGTNNLTSDNTDLSTEESTYTNSDTVYAIKGSGDTYGYIYENGTVTWVPEKSTIAYNESNAWNNSNVKPYSYDYLSNDGNPVYPDVNVAREIAGNHGLSGNYYNWTEAIASNDSTNADSITEENITNSICPKGWRLPNNTNKEFGNLLVAYNIIKTNTSNSYIPEISSVDSLGRAPLYFVRSGQFTGTLSKLGDAGLYWSNTFYLKQQSGSSYAYFLGFDSDTISPYYNNRLYGQSYKGVSIRCIAK